MSSQFRKYLTQNVVLWSKSKCDRERRNKSVWWFNGDGKMRAIGTTWKYILAQTHTSMHIRCWRLGCGEWECVLSPTPLHPLCTPFMNVILSTGRRKILAITKKTTITSRCSPVGQRHLQEANHHVLFLLRALNAWHNKALVVSKEKHSTKSGLASKRAGVMGMTTCLV